MTTSVKTCFRCGESKPLTEFYRHPRMADGRVGKCKKCNREDNKANRAAKVEKYRQYDRDRGYRPGPKHKVAARMATRVLKKKPCEVCNEIKVEAHHDDYTKPLDVRWLCKTHHAEVHIRQGI